MAARQGLSAQISQASEDAKRAVLQRAPLKSSWFSNLNTTCTIKSAPPRTPEVLNLLSTKCGWLIKRNEQHVWQSRWCCVVPHTFLYYFDADIGVGEGAPTAPPASLQESLNEAVREGFTSGNTAPRSSLYNVFPTPDHPDVVSDEKFNTLQPAGIIDLECYTAVHRSSQNELILELAGDDSVNPDLRSFYFYSNSESDSEQWTQALLSMRHQALVDEREAFREVCDGFAQQLQQLHVDLEDAKLKQEEAVEECYRVRSQSEEQRRSSIRIIQEALERTDTTDQPFGTARRACRSDLETVQQQHMGVLPAAKLLSDYTLALENTCSDLNQENQQLKDQLRRTSDVDQQANQELQDKMEQMQNEWVSEKRQLQHQVSTLQQKLSQSQKQVKVAQHEVSTQRGDLKTQISTLTSHKKILKKEVLDLRAKLKELGRELSQLKHYTRSAKMDLAQERQKGQLLNKYIEKMETQVRVQQNMMEMMSQSASVMGNSMRDDDDHDFFPSASPRGNVVLVRNTTTSTDEAVDGESDYNFAEETTTPRHGKKSKQSPQRPSPEKPRSTQKNVICNGIVDRALEHMHDDKSHVSELTEDRTQRQFDAVYRGDSFQDSTTDNVVPKRSSSFQSPKQGPPSFIGVEGSDMEPPPTPQQPKLDTINNLSSASLGPPTAGAARRTPTHPRGKHHQQQHRSNSASSWTFESSGSGSLASAPQQRLSVAQQARLDAERKTSTPVKVRVNGGSFRSSPVRARSPGSVASQGSFFTKLENRIVAAIDNSVLGVPDDLLEDALESEEDSSFHSEEEERHTTTDDEERYTSVSDTYTDDKNSSNEENKRSDNNRISSSRRSDRLKRLHDERRSPKKTPTQSKREPALTLEERKAMQRAKQVAFLKEQGLIRDEGNLRGGAGASRSDAGSGVSLDSRSSFSKSYLRR